MAYGVAAALDGTARWFRSIGLRHRNCRHSSALWWTWAPARLWLGVDTKGSPVTRAALAAGLGVTGAAAQRAAFWRGRGARWW
jgi:hypothetical protein